MNNAFDKILASDTWFKNHPNDRKRFFLALKTVVRNPAFSPDLMGDYMREQTRLPGVEETPFEPYIQNLVAIAWVVKDYLAAIEE